MGLEDIERKVDLLLEAVAELVSGFDKLVAVMQEQKISQETEVAEGLKKAVVAGFEKIGFTLVSAPETGYSALPGIDDQMRLPTDEEIKKTSFKDLSKLIKR